MEAIPAASRQDLIQILATEHFTLQGARSGAISDANGRTNFFLGSLSSVVVGLALIGQVTQLGTGFRIFALVLLPSMLFVGLVSFERLLQLGIENVRCVIAINGSAITTWRWLRSWHRISPSRRTTIRAASYSAWARSTERSGGGTSR